MKVAQFLPWIDEKEYLGIKPCFDENWITEGPKSKAFVEAILDLTGAKYGILAPNGTLALYLALRAVGIGSGDEVIVPDFTFIASATSVNMCGAVPVFCDVNSYNFQIDVAKCSELISPRTKAIMPVHIFGTSVDMDSVVEFARKFGLFIVEDAAQGIGIRYKGQHTGTFGTTGTFSFFADKTITTGEGGFVCTNDEDIYKSLLYLRNQGRLNRGSFVHEAMGYNFRMTDLQAAIGLVQLEKLEEIVRRKDFIWNRYRANLGGLKYISFFAPELNANFIPFRVGILCDRAQDLLAYMSQKNIEARTFFFPLHRQPCFKYLEALHPNAGWLKDENFPNAIAGYRRGVCLPSYPTIEPEKIDYVCEVISDFFGKPC